MALTSWLIDKSAYVRLSAARSPELWIGRIERGLVRVSTVTRLEVGFSTRTAADHNREFTSPPMSLLPVAYLTPAIERRAEEVQSLLAAQGRHRAPSIPDLLIAATAELLDLTVLAVDKDFDLIADITGQPVEWIELGESARPRNRID